MEQFSEESVGGAASFLEPSDQMCEEITRQTELVFSDASLSKDTFLLKHVKRNKEGYINLKLLISAYKPIKRLTQDWRQIAFSIRKCSSQLGKGSLYFPRKKSGL